MEKFMTADEMRSFQKESLENPSSEVSTLLSEILKKAKHAASKNENKITFWFVTATTHSTFKNVLFHLERLGYSVLGHNFGNDVRGDWCSFVEISW